MEYSFSVLEHVYLAGKRIFSKQAILLNDIAGTSHLFETELNS